MTLSPDQKMQAIAVWAKSQKKREMRSFHEQLTYAAAHQILPQI